MCLCCMCVCSVHCTDRGGLGGHYDRLVRVPRINILHMLVEYADFLLRVPASGARERERERESRERVGEREGERERERERV